MASLQRRPSILAQIRASAAKSNRSLTEPQQSTTTQLEHRSWVLFGDLKLFGLSRSEHAAALATRARKMAAHTSTCSTCARAA